MNMVMSTGYSGSTHICMMEKNDVRPDKLYAFIFISFGVFALDVAKV